MTAFFRRFGRVGCGGVGMDARMCWKKGLIVDWRENSRSHAVSEFVAWYYRALCPFRRPRGAMLRQASLTRIREDPKRLSLSDLKLLSAVAEGMVVEAEKLGGLAFIASGHLECFCDVVFLNGLQYGGEVGTLGGEGGK